MDKWLAEIAKVCGSLIVIGGVIYFALGMRFVTKEEYAVHLAWSAAKTGEVNLVEAKLLQTNEGILLNLEKLNAAFERLNDRMARVETRLEAR